MSSPDPRRQLPEGLAAGPVVLDASYVIALLQGEHAAQAYASLLARAVLPAPAAGEVFYKLHAASGLQPEQVEAGLAALGVRLVDLPVAAARYFPALRAIDDARRAEQRQDGERQDAVVGGWVRTELSARAEREVLRARRNGPYSLGRFFPDTPGAPSRDDEGVPVVEPLEEWVARSGR